MTYYRIAWKHHQSSVWQWKSTKLTSLQTVFHFLRLHEAIPRDHLRVFSSSSSEGLKELLEEENQGRQQISATAEYFLRERGLHVGKMTRRASEQGGSGIQKNQEKKVITATLPPLLNQNSAQEAPVVEKRISVLDRRRLEIEMGAGGDHDLPYTFALPLSLPQKLAWIRLMARVQRAELEPSV
jgi:hypothetical protein